MTRWHESSCETPNVVIDEKNNPTCRSCKRSCPSIEELLAENVSASSSLVLPPDEPEGQMDLWWPLSVPYDRKETPMMSQESFEKAGKVSPPDKPLHRARSRPKSIARPMSTAQFHIYGDALKPNEFRLACITYAQTKDCPVHLSLETYTHDDRPEYEAVSYTWGGEDDDSSPNRPVFIGSYWDVSLQSKNCLSMLRFIRPWRGVRMVWVDALCINQQNLEERGTQVANMRQIYTECSRVVVYLGDDIVTSSRSFPIFKDLNVIQDAGSATKLYSLFPEGHELNGEPFDLRDLLSRRYFSRVWVIQELIVSDSAVFRVGEVDFRAHAAILAKVRELPSILDRNAPPRAFRWNTTSAPWVQYLGQKTFPRTIVQDVFSLAKLTSRSQSSDPRDRIFGLVSLLGDDQQRQEFYPDYSLSFKHFSIGFFAHIFLNKEDSAFMQKAGIVTGSEPSWVPMCRDHSSWREVLSACVPDAQNDINKHLGLRHPRVFLDKSMKIPIQQAFSIASNRSKTASGPSFSLEGTVDPATGALGINLTHIFMFECHPLLWGEFGALKIFSGINYISDGTPVKSRLLLASNIRLDLEIKPRRDHLFILNPGPASSIKNSVLYLILRKYGLQNGLETFKLVTSCVSLLEEKGLGSFKEPKPENLKSYERGWPSIPEEAVKEILNAQISVSLVMDHLYRQLGKFKCNVNDMLASFTGRSENDRFAHQLVKEHVKNILLVPQWQQVLPGVREQERFWQSWLFLCRGLYKHGLQARQDGDPSRNPMLLAYTSCLDQRYDPKIAREKSKDGRCWIDYVQFSFQPEEWAARLHNIYMLPNLYSPNPYQRMEEGAGGHTELRLFTPYHDIDRRSLDPYKWTLLCQYRGFNWQWRRADQSRWQSTVHRDLYQHESTWMRARGSSAPSALKSKADLSLQGGSHRIYMRAPVEEILQFVAGQLNECKVRESLELIMQAYQPSLDVDTTIDMLVKGPTREQEFIGIPKYIGGVSVDGSTYKVGIV